MRVLFVSPSIARSYGGPTTSLAGYLQSAAAVGISVEIVSPSPSPEDETWFVESSQISRIHLRSAIGRGAFVLSPGLGSWLGANARRFDVVHVTGLGNPVSSLAARHCRASGIPYVIRPHGMLSRITFEHRRRVLKQLYFGVLDRPNIREAAGVHFTTADEQRQAAWHGIDWRGRAHIIPPPWQATPHTTRPASAGPPTVIVIALVKPVKGIEAVIDAWPIIRKSVVGARLVVAGSGAPRYVESLKSRARDLGVDQHVEFPGFVTGASKAALLARATAMALTSHHENFGVSVLEGIAQGIPVVVTPEVALASFVSEKGLGLVTDRQPQAVAEAVIQALSDNALREKCRIAGPAAAAEHFSHATIGHDLLRMFNAAVSAR